MREDIPKNAAVLLDFVQMRRGKRALSKFFVTFSIVHFWSIKGVYFLQNANNLNFNFMILLFLFSLSF